ncbi:MAG: FGGY family carbohydrate kinase [Acidimicrobiales bacterium]
MSPRSSTPVAVAIDAGTTGVRAQVVDARGTVVDTAYRELTQYFPRPGWVEHDPDEIWLAVQATLDEVAHRLDSNSGTGAGVGARPPGTGSPAAIGITNQRETVVAWDRRTGRPCHRAIVWQDRRTANACDALVEAGHLPRVRELTGLVLDPYFSATKMHWLVTEGGVSPVPDLALGTVDSWILWNLTGGTDGGVFATDATNASRTSVFDIVERRWSDELCDLFGVPAEALAPVHPCCGRFGKVAASALGSHSALVGVPISGMAGDQHAALFGQACFTPGMAKVTYGTGSFVLTNTGPVCPPPVDGLITTLAWDLGAHAPRPGTGTGPRSGTGPGPGSGSGSGSTVSYALEGSVFASGAAIQWLRDGMAIIERSSDMEELAGSVETSLGVVIVPAFTGLGSPHWDPYARGTITGLSRGANRAHLARAVIEAMAFQVGDVLDAMSATVTPQPSILRADGGASVMDLLLRMQSDRSGIPVARPLSVETTGLGAATLAGLAEGVWGSLDELADLWSQDVLFAPRAPTEQTEASGRAWRRALDASRLWAAERSRVTEPGPGSGDQGASG